ncbi:Receptor-type guanylate cyclase gcy [Seminavis robusta]|uniref:Receptor-type guanylate cyclase gcy n=1 Tax=Seminavis robusta TaxID=568900 RepID=A0A9N8HID4_9STRA|nr:Receptor-type guanylate cyclase gcy [Seminavis robusta]|eukprot:Sro774_g200700.1 Receptor-type guanylate cyclase gcy (1424) ;mRNA; f:34771-40799
MDMVNSFFGRRSSAGTGSSGGDASGSANVPNPAAAASSSHVDYGYGEISHNPSSASSDSDWPDDMSDKESLQSWAKDTQKQEEEDDEDLFGTKEEHNLKRWFIVVTVLLLFLAIGVSVFTYWYLSTQEQDTFERAFENTAQAIVDGADYRMKVIERSLLGKSQALTTFAVFTGSLWPFVSMPDFYVSGRNFLIETETQMIAWAPLVTNQPDLRAWEAYSTYMLENSGWFPPVEVEERLEKQAERLEEQAKQQRQHEGRSTETPPPDLEFSDAGGLYVPLWQVSPWLYNALINHNLTAQFEDSMTLLLRTKQPVWTRFVDINNPYSSTTGDIDEPISVYEVNQPQQEEPKAATNETVVASFLFQPVFKALRNHDVSYEATTNITTDQEEIVAIYLTAVQWDSFLGSLVPEGTPGVSIVLTNQWGQTLTYQVSTDNEGRVTASTTLVGSGDQHSSDYDDLSKTTNLAKNTMEESILVNELVPSVAKVVSPRHPHTVEELQAKDYPETHPLMIEARQSLQQETAEEFAYSGNLKMTIYPTADFENAYTSMQPLTMTLILAALGCLGTVSFYLYSQSVHNRQQKLVETANRTALVVKSLFPSNVRDRIMKEAEEVEQKNQAKKKKAQQKQLDGSNSERGPGGSTAGSMGHGGVVSGGSILGGLSVGSAGSRHSRSSRRYAPGSLDDSRSREFTVPQRNSSMGASNPYGSAPIADHFNATTVLFADMVGFTAWSSVREPVQVFTLLETIYHAFDKVARKRGIFKVETIGDCYVAVCGLPVPRPDHAIAMAYFANDCLRKMITLTKKLEITLGPDTGDLSLRIGLHSGPVTAGVLRGEKSRFQLFGDTVNTASRMESNGRKDCIHISEATATLLMESGKQRWLSQRRDKIVAKGKGEMVTYWLEVRSSLSNYIESSSRRRASGASGESGGTGGTGGTDDDVDGSSMGDSNSDLEPKMPDWEKDVSLKGSSPQLGDRFQRLVDWNVEQLVNLLKKVVANRKPNEDAVKGSHFDLRTDSSILEEVTEVIPFPKPNIADILVGDTQPKQDVELDSAAVAQLHEFLTTIAMLYNDNSFHNFAHASHVAMALITWLSRITPLPSDGDTENMYEAKLTGDWKRRSNPCKDMFALQADPLTHFALIFAALIHDLDHTGVPNATLVKEKSQIATLYNNTSIHEQASVDSAFETLMDDKYEQLRDVLFTTEEEFYRFRQIVMNSVMATDILDEKIMAKQSVRWGCLFRDADDEEDDAVFADDYAPENEGDQKASLVVERLLLVSDIAHTMQHWYVYRKWNSKLFEEAYFAFKAGRADIDPSITWYEDEITFFDTYVIPLATKMRECELFDSSCEEGIRYATSNREQWVTTGAEEVASMVESCNEIEFEVEDTYNPIPDGRIFAPSNGRPSLRGSFKKGMDMSLATFDTVLGQGGRGGR